jgi:hypothetical protein
MNEPDPDDLVTVTSAATEFEAGAIVAVLEEAGIRAFAFGAVQATNPFNANASGVPVQVRQGDFDAAQAALTRNVQDSIDLDWDEVDVGSGELVPEFHHKPGQMPVIAKVSFAIAVALLLIVILGSLWWAWQPLHP